MEVKAIYLSKRFWINLALAVTPLYPPAFEYISGNEATVMSFFAVINIILTVTSKNKIALW